MTTSERGATRRAFVGGAAGLIAWHGAARAAGTAMPALPETPVSLSIIDVAGNLQLSQKAFDAYRRERPKLVSRIALTQAPAPELPGKIRAQQAAGRVDIDIVLTGTDALAAGIQQNIWQPLFPDLAAAFPPDLEARYQPAAWAMQGLAQGQGLCIDFCPAGPLLEYMPDRVPTPPTTTGELLDWTRAHPKRFFYARPANSGPGRAWLMGLPYLLGDRDPKDPKDGWEKTWAYLAELGRNIEYYPTGTTATMKELGEGSRDIIVTMTGWDISPRVLGVVPKEAMVGTLKGFHFVTDAQYMATPKGLAPEKLAVVLDLMAYMLGESAQAMAWDRGYFYPGPAIRNAPLDRAPADSQAAIAEFGRDFYAKLIEDTPKETPLAADRMVYAFDRWDQQIGAKAGK
jgi:putative spermidine/putrescine transport system substrate-binding protein